MTFSQATAYPLRIRVAAQHELEKDSDLLIDQLRAIDNRRLVHGPVASLADKQLKLVYSAVCEVIGYSSVCTSLLQA